MSWQTSLFKLLAKGAKAGGKFVGGTAKNAAVFGAGALLGGGDDEQSSASRVGSSPYVPETSSYDSSAPGSISTSIGALKNSRPLQSNTPANDNDSAALTRTSIVASKIFTDNVVEAVDQSNRQIMSGLNVVNSTLVTGFNSVLGRVSGQTQFLNKLQGYNEDLQISLNEFQESLNKMTYSGGGGRAVGAQVSSAVNASTMQTRSAISGLSAKVAGISAALGALATIALTGGGGATDQDNSGDSTGGAQPQKNGLLEFGKDMAVDAGLGIAGTAALTPLIGAGPAGWAALAGVLGWRFGLFDGILPQGLKQNSPQTQTPVTPSSPTAPNAMLFAPSSALAGGSYNTPMPSSSAINTNQNGAYPSKAELIDYIRKSAAARGIDPDVAVRVAESEGLNGNPAEAWQSNVIRKDGSREQSFTPFQLYMGGGLGNEYQKQTGLDPRDPANVYSAIDFSLNQAAQNGWGAWYGARNAGIQNYQGLESASPVPLSSSYPTTQGSYATPGMGQNQNINPDQVIADVVSGKISAGDAVVQQALSMKGLNEVRDREQIMNYLKSGGSNIDPASTAWCAAFVNASLARAGIQGTGSNAAGSFQNWGDAVTNPEDVRAGDVVVNRSLSLRTGMIGSHVGIASGPAYQDSNGNWMIPTVEGNESDSVSTTARSFAGHNVRRANSMGYGPGQATAGRPGAGGQPSPMSAMQSQYGANQFTIPSDVMSTLQTVMNTSRRTAMTSELATVAAVTASMRGSADTNIVNNQVNNNPSQKEEIASDNPLPALSDMLETLFDNFIGGSLKPSSFSNLSSLIG